MNKPSDRLINLFGALTQEVSDKVRQAIAESFTGGGETAAALSVIGHEPGMSIAQISQVLRLSHAGAVRLVERLMTQGFVMKSRLTEDRRVLHVTLTPKGQVQRTELLNLRKDTVAYFLAQISIEERAVLERVAETILASLQCDPLEALSTCRFCDEQRCPDCPMDDRGRLATPTIFDKQG